MAWEVRSLFRVCDGLHCCMIGRYCWVTNHDLGVVCGLRAYFGSDD